MAYAHRVIVNGQVSRRCRLAGSELVVDVVPYVGVDAADMSELDAATIESGPQCGSSLERHDAATKQTVVVRWFAGLTVTVLAVAGPYVLVESNPGVTSWLVDTRTGAAASIQSGGSPATGNGILAYSAYPVVLHVDELPQLAR